MLSWMRNREGQVHTSPYEEIDIQIMVKVKVKKVKKRKYWWFTASHRKGGLATVLLYYEGLLL